MDYTQLFSKFKNPLKRTIFSSLILPLLIGTSISAQTLPLIPYPQKVQLLEGNLNLEVEFTVRFTGDRSIMAVQLLEELIKTKEPKDKKVQIWIGIPAQDQSLNKLAQKKDIDPASLGREGYHLLIEPETIVLTANSEAGLLYGVQTFRQLYRAYQAAGFMPTVKITDFPSVAYRGMMDDISRGPLPNMDFLRQQMLRLAELKINQWTFYIEHVIKTKKHGSFSPKEGITIEEFEQLAKEAKQYNIELLGSFQSLGHFRNILSFPQYASLGATDRMLKPGDPKALQFIKEVYDEMIPVFSSDFFSINCDETWDLSRGMLKPLADSIGAGRIYANHTVPLLEYVKQKGKRPMIWGDMVLKYPEVFDYLPKETVFGTWEYSAFDSFADWIDPIKEKGFDFWVCTGVLNSYRMMPNFRTTVVNIQNFINEGYEKGMQGVLNTVWDDGGRHFFSKDWYGVAYAAEQSWQPNKKPIEDFNQRFSKTFYLDEESNFSKMIADLNKLADFVTTQNMSNSFFQAKILPEVGEMVYWDDSEWTDIDFNAHGAERFLWKLQAAPKVEGWSRDLDYWAFTIKQYRTWVQSREALVRIAENYHASCFLQNTKPNEVKKQLESMLEEVDRIKQLWIGLKEEFHRLWLLENRTYWLREAISLYENRISAFENLEALLTEVNQNYDPTKGNYLPPPKKIRLDIRIQSGKYFTYWLVEGPFSIDAYTPPFPDFVADQGGELNVRPTAFDWLKYQSPLTDRVDFTQLYEKNMRAVAYAYCRIESSKDQRVKATFGSNDGIEIILNGQRIFQKHEKRSLILDEDEVWLDLKKGKNHVVLKVDQWKSGWGVSFRLPDVTVRNNKYKYRIVE